MAGAGAEQVKCTRYNIRYNIQIWMRNNDESSIIRKTPIGTGREPRSVTVTVTPGPPAVSLPHYIILLVLLIHFFYEASCVEISV